MNKANPNDATKCENCEDGYIYEKTIRVVDSNCYHCGEKMKIAFGRSGYSTYGPIAFTALEMEIAIQNGAILAENYSHTREEKYLSNSCTKCGAFVGNWFLKDYFFSSDLGHANYLDVKTSVFSCDYCSEINNEDHSNETDDLQV